MKVKDKAELPKYVFIMLGALLKHFKNLVSYITNG